MRCCAALIELCCAGPCCTVDAQPLLRARTSGGCSGRAVSGPAAPPHASWATRPPGCPTQLPPLQLVMDTTAHLSPPPPPHPSTHPPLPPPQLVMDVTPRQKLRVHAPKLLLFLPFQAMVSADLYARVGARLGPFVLPCRSGDGWVPCWGRLYARVGAAGAACAPCRPRDGQQVAPGASTCTATLAGAGPAPRVGCAPSCRSSRARGASLPSQPLRQPGQRSNACSVHRAGHALTLRIAACLPCRSCLQLHDDRDAEADRAGCRGLDYSCASEPYAEVFNLLEVRARGEHMRESKTIVCLQLSQTARVEHLGSWGDSWACPASSTRAQQPYPQAQRAAAIGRLQEHRPGGGPHALQRTRTRHALAWPQGLHGRFAPCATPARQHAHLASQPATHPPPPPPPPRHPPLNLTMFPRPSFASRSCGANRKGKAELQATADQMSTLGAAGGERVRADGLAAGAGAGSRAATPGAGHRVGTC